MPESSLLSSSGAQACSWLLLSQSCGGLQALASYKCNVWVIWCPLQGEPEFQKPGWGRDTLQQCVSCATHRTAWPNRLLWRDTAPSVTTSVWATLCLQTGSTRLPKCSAKAVAILWPWRPLLRHMFCQKLLPRGRKTESAHGPQCPLPPLPPRPPVAHCWVKFTTSRIVHTSPSATLAGEVPQSPPTGSATFPGTSQGVSKAWLLLSWEPPSATELLCLHLRACVLLGPVSVINIIINLSIVLLT